MVTKWVLDGLAVEASLRGPVTVLAVLLVAGTFIGLVQGIMLGTLAERIILATRTGMVRHLLGVRVAELDRRSGGEMGGRLAGVLRALRTVKASRAEEREARRIGAFAERSATKAVRAVRIETVAWTITGGGVNLAVMLVLGFGAYRVAGGSLEVSALIAFLLYLFGLTWPVMMLTMSLTALQSGLAAAARIHEVTSMQLEPTGDSARPAPPARMPGRRRRWSCAGCGSTTRPTPRRRCTAWTVLDADQIVVLEAGRVRAIGTHTDLLAGDALYAELVAALRIADEATQEVVRTVEPAPSA